MVDTVRRAKPTFAWWLVTALILLATNPHPWTNYIVVTALWLFLSAGWVCNQDQA